MSKLILMSIVFASYAVPIWFAQSGQPRRALRRVQWIMLGFIVVWAVMCREWYPLLVELK